MAYITRLLEMYVCSAVPSSICLWILYKVPPNATLWKVLCFIAFFVTLIANIWFWYDYIMHTNDDNRAFYYVNAGAFIAYMASSVVLYKFTTPQIFSMMYACTRPFEVFHLTTKVSAAITFAIFALFMVITKVFAVKLFGINVSFADYNSLAMESIEDESITLHNIRSKKEQIKDEETSSVIEKDNEQN